MKKLISWLDNNIVKLLLMGYVFVIPLWPKLPLKMINYTYIAIRMEDLYVGLLVAVFLIQLLRKKIVLKKTLVIPILVFWGAVFASFVWGYYVSKTIVFQHLGLLHSLRRVEYMVAFFMFAASIQKKEDFYLYLKLIMGALFLVTGYGLGQKYLGWPAVQTMNPEYAKGYLLVLDANARISSTFGGHYDLAAYLIFLMPLTLGLFLSTSGAWYYFFVFFLSLYALVLTASRVSYGAYFLSTIPFLLFMRKFKLLFVVLVLTIGLTLLSSNLTSRISRTFQTRQIFIDKTTGQTTVPRRLKPDELPIGDYVINKKAVEDSATDVGSSNLNAKDVADAKANIRDEIVKNARMAGKTLTRAEEDALVEEAFAKMKVVSTMLPDISFATRLQVEWPRAIKAFMSNPVLGKGPSSITEASDNDYLRWLGEFGLVGTVSFLAILFLIAKSMWKKAVTTATDEKYLFWGILFSGAGLMVNASYIDVFEASKVAYIFWMIAGIFMGYATLKKTTPVKAVAPARRKKK